MNAIQVFKTPDNAEIRVTSAKGEPWFVAKDVAERLDYSESSNAARLFGHIPDDWKGVNRIHTPGGAQEMLCLSEPGLYFFLARSDKPKALPFQKWIAGEVLPSIRKTGAYVATKARQGRMPGAAFAREVFIRYGQEEGKKRIDFLIGYTAPPKHNHVCTSELGASVYQTTAALVDAIESDAGDDAIDACSSAALNPLLELCTRYCDKRTAKGIHGEPAAKAVSK
jgi:prophage antirepressor-like protein